MNNLIEILLTIVIISIWCNGVYIVTSEHQLGYPLRQWLKPKFSEYLFKPILGCVTCMASIHGAYIYLFLHGWDWNLILCCVCAAWLNPVLYTKYDP